MHAGRISASAGGRVELQIWPGAPRYLGSTRNGITTASWGSYDASFSFDVVSQPPTAAELARRFPPDPWIAQAQPGLQLEAAGEVE